MPSSWRGFLVSLAAGCGLMMADAASAAPVTTPIGGLLFEHDDAVWTAETGDDTALISCIVKDCAFTMIEVFFAPTAERCDEESALAAAAVAFPRRDMRSVNMHDLNGLAVYVTRNAVRTAVYDPNAGDAVYACLDRAGVRYEFLTRPGDRPPARGDEWHVFGVLAALTAPPAPITTVSLGGVELSFPADRWTPSAATTEHGPTTLFCLPPHCDGHVPLFVAVEPAKDVAGSCLPPELGAGTPGGSGDVDVTRIAIADGRLSLEFATIHSGCRAWSPPQFGACTNHDGVRYSVWTGWTAGCHFGPAISEGAFLDLVQTLRPVSAP